MSAAAKPAATVDIRAAAPGRIAVQGELTFATARGARELGLVVLEETGGQQVVIDLVGVTRGDSAGLAVLLDWLAWGRRRARTVTLANIPASLLAIARISELDGLLTAG